MKGASKLDPVQALNLPGELVGFIECPRMLPPVPGLRWPNPRARHHACSGTASLVRFPDPFGLRSYCEDGHVDVLAPTSIPGLAKPIKGETD